MPEGEEITVPTGFIRVYIRLESKVSPDSLAFVESSVNLYSEDDKFINSIPWNAGSRYTITVTPGKYRLNASLGKLQSEFVTVEVGAGEVKDVLFHFGKKPE